MKAICGMLCAAMALAGCGGGSINSHAFEGVVYDGRVASSRADRKAFVATARPVSRGLEGARQAAAYEGVQHCIDFYGTSDIDWEIGPDTPDEALVIENDTMTFRGRCDER